MAQADRGQRHSSDGPLKEPVMIKLMRLRGISCQISAFPDEHILCAHAKRRGRIFLDYLRNGRGTTRSGTHSPERATHR
jgi:bifunctional non-homologous end joining protein LigD